MTVLAIDDDSEALEAYRATLSEMGVSFESTSDPGRGIDLVRDLGPELVLLQWHMPNVQGVEVLRSIHNLDMRAQVAVIYDQESVESVAEAIQEGAAKCISKPVSPQKLRALVEQVRELAQRRAQSAKLEKELIQLFNLEGMIGRSPRMLELFDLVRRVSPHFRTALILGETGSGKELVARALHKMSPRQNRAFAVCNCAAVMETLFESELFGHRKGAFTGAHEDRAGIIETADGGIVFLDEVGELNPAVQSKLLRVIQNQEIQRVGSSKPQHVDVLLIAATSRNLEREVKRGQFRADLFFRLNMIEIPVPALRERVEDIPLLYRYFLEKFNQQYGKEIQGISRRAQDLMLTYPWPGNVRELENTMGRACMLAQGSFLDVHDFTTISERIAGVPGGNAPCSLEEAERAAVIRALDSTPNKSQVARVLGVSRPRLYRLIEKHGLTAKAGRDDDRETVPEG